MTYSPTSCAVSTGSDRCQPRHERRHPVPSRRRRQDRCARIAGKKCHSAPPTPPIGPQSSGSARRWPSFEGKLHLERFRVTLNGLGGFHMGNPGSILTACSAPSATSRPQRPKQITMPPARTSIWLHDSNQTASGKPGRFTYNEFEFRDMTGYLRCHSKAPTKRKRR